MQSLITEDARTRRRQRVIVGLSGVVLLGLAAGAVAAGQPWGAVILGSLGALVVFAAVRQTPPATLEVTPVTLTFSYAGGRRVTRIERGRVALVRAVRSPGSYVFLFSDDSGRKVDSALVSAFDVPQVGSALAAAGWPWRGPEQR